MTPDEIIAAVLAEGGFDQSSANQSAAVVLGWVNDARRKAIEDAKWLKATVSLGPTVAGQSQYAVTEDVVDLLMLQVGGGVPWLRISMEDLEALHAGSGTISGAPGAYAPNFESDADAVVDLWPAPATAGEAITGVAAITPLDIVAGGTEATVKLPKRFHRDICVHGAIAEGKLLVEEDPEAAAISKGIYEAAVELLRRRANSRIGSGPQTVKLYR